MRVAPALRNNKMKITKTQLRDIIKEELEAALKEIKDEPLEEYATGPHDQPAGGADSLAQKKAKCKGKWMEHGMEGFDGSRGWHGYCDEKKDK